MKPARRGSKPRRTSKRVALPRLAGADWSQWLELSVDRATWPATFEEWQRDAEARAARLGRAGLEVLWVDLEPRAFSAWCQARGFSTDAEARNRFAAEQIGNMPPSAPLDSNQ